MENSKWSEFIRFQRNKKKLSSRQLAAMVGVDPSYISLMERNGCIPRRDKVVALAKALDIKMDMLLIMAGYAPEEASFYVTLSEYGCAELAEKLIPELSNLLIDVCKLNKRTQRSVVQFLEPLLETINRMEQRKKNRRR